MRVLKNDNTFAIRCDCCDRLFDGSDVSLPDTTAKTGDGAEEKASNYDFFCCDPLHICESCQQKIHKGLVLVDFVPNPTVPVEQCVRECPSLDRLVIEAGKKAWGLYAVETELFFPHLVIGGKGMDVLGEFFRDIGWNWSEEHGKTWDLYKACDKRR